MIKLGEHKKLKAKFFLDGNINQLEKKVNEFLLNIDRIDLIDVKYEMTDIGTAGIHNISHSAMIVYEEY